MTTKETFSELETPLDWTKKTDKKVNFIWIDVDGNTTLAETDKGHMVAIYKDRGYCTCEDFNFVKRKLRVPCKHLIRLRELINK